MHTEILKYICCIDCGGNLNIRSNSIHNSNLIIEVAIECDECNSIYPINNGVPNFIKGRGEAENSITAKGFTAQWDARSKGLFEASDIFGFTKEDYLENFCYAFNITDIKEMQGVNVEAGIGSGILSETIALMAPNSVVIGLDISDQVYEISKRSVHIKNLHIIKADLCRSPIKKHTVNRVYSSGVLHHIPSISLGIRSLFDLLSNNGIFYFWVYPDYKKCAYDKVRNFIGSSFLWPFQVRLIFSYFLSPFLWTYFKISKNYSYKSTLENIKTVQFRIYDNISPEYQFRYSKDDINLILDKLECNSEVINDLGFRVFKK